MKAFRRLRFLLAALMICLLFHGCGSNGPTFDGVSVAGVDLTGLTEQEAVEAVRQATKDTYTHNSMVIQVMDTTVEITPEQSGAALNVEAAVGAAMQWHTQNGGRGVFDAIPYMAMDTSVVNSTVADLQQSFSAPKSDAYYTLVGTKPSLAHDGVNEPCQTLILNTGTPEYDVNFDGLYAKVLDAYNTNTFRVKLDGTAVAPKGLDLDAIYQSLYTAPVDAVLDEDTFEVTYETYGYHFDLEHAKNLLSLSGYGDVIEIPMERISPTVFSESISSMLYRDVLASYSTPHTKDENRNTNLTLACQAINGYIVLPGETFDYNAVVGERTEEKGYKGAGAYENGLTVTTIGGGVCQVSSTIYYCCLVADLNIVSQRAHSYVPSYMPAGTDAAVSWPNLHFRFRNNTNYPIRIEADVSGGYVNISLIGTDEKDYYIVLDTENVYTRKYETVYEEYAPDNAEGYYDGQVLVTPYTGCDVKTYKCKYDKQTNELISRDYYATSYYEKRDRVVCKIVDPSATEPSEPTEPSDSTGPTIPDDFAGSGGGIGEDTGGAL